MSPLLEQFILEGRDFLQGIGEKLMALEDEPDSVELMTELFRLVHTLKGNSGLFDFPEMTRVLHAGEDLMDSIRDGRVVYSQQLADVLLDAMDFVGMLLDQIESRERIDPGQAERAQQLAQGLRALIPQAGAIGPAVPDGAARAAPADLPALERIPEAARIAAWRAAAGGSALFWVAYRPDEDSFFKGEDPFHQVRQTPGLLWGDARPRTPWPALGELDCYRCQTDFFLLVAGQRSELDEYFRYMPDQVTLNTVAPLALVLPAGHPNGGPVYGDFVAEALALLAADDLAGLETLAQTLLELSSPELWLASDLRWLLAIIDTCPERRDVLRRLIEALSTLSPPDLSDLTELGEAGGAPSGVPVEPVGKPAPVAAERARIDAMLAVQADILALSDGADWLPGRLKAVATTIKACLLRLGEAPAALEQALASALAERHAGPLRVWLDALRAAQTARPETAVSAVPETVAPAADERRATADDEAPPASPAPGVATGASGETPFGRRADDAQVGKVLKVDQAKVDLLMNLIGEMVVAKNSLPYLANRAESQYGVRELAREIKAQYAVINRIAEEMQGAIMQVRMTPVSLVFQRFPRLVRDISRKLGKDVELILEGEDTEADKNIVEALADPLVHIIRNSLDHGLEVPELRLAAGKPRAGRLRIRAVQQADRVLIEIIDDGRGIDPAVIKRKAYEKGLIDEATLERISDQEAINLVFAAGFSTVDTISDLSGRGVGMDVVRHAIDKVGGAVSLSSEVGQGTTLRLSLPLSMAVTNVMIVETDRQIFGVPMDMVVETVRLPRADMRTIKRQRTAVRRGRIVPLVALNELLALPAEPLVNADDEFAALLVRVDGEQVGLLVDDFREVVDVILKPLPGELGKLSTYAGTALLGDGSVLMVLNPKGLF